MADSEGARQRYRDQAFFAVLPLILDRLVEDMLDELDVNELVSEEWRSVLDDAASLSAYFAQTALNARDGVAPAKRRRRRRR